MSLNDFICADDVVVVIVYATTAGRLGRTIVIGAHMFAAPLSALSDGSF